MVVSLWIFGLRRTEPAGRAFSMLTTSLAIVIGALFDLYTSHYFTYVWTLAVALSGGALIDLALGFPAGSASCYRSSLPALDRVCRLALVLAINAYLHIV